jgi:hypothetical protein
LLEELVEHYNLTSEKAKATLLLKLQKKEQETEEHALMRGQYAAKRWR